MTDDEIDALSTPDRWPDVFDAAEVAALELADAISDDPTSLDTGLLAALRKHFDEVQRAEIILVCGQANLNNRAGNAAKLLLGPDTPASDEPAT